MISLRDRAPEIVTIYRCGSEGDWLQMSTAHGGEERDGWDITESEGRNDQYP